MQTSREADGSIERVRNILGDILSRDDTPRNSEMNTLVFEYGSTANGQFDDLIQGKRMQAIAGAIFGTQFSSISDIVFSDSCFQFTSKDWQAWKLLNMFDPSLNVKEKKDYKTTISTIKDFENFINVCNTVLVKRAAKEVKKLCENRVSSSRKAVIEIHIESKKKEKWGGLFSHKRVEKGKLSLSLSSTDNSYYPTHKRRKSMNKVQNPPIFVGGSSKSNLDALDLPQSRRTRRETFKAATHALADLIKLENEVEVCDVSWQTIQRDKEAVLVHVGENYTAELGIEMTEEAIPWIRAFGVYETHNDQPFYKETICSSTHKHFLGLDYMNNLVMVAFSTDKLQERSSIIVHTVDKTFKYYLEGDHKPREIAKGIRAKLANFQIYSLKSYNEPAISHSFERIENSYRIHNYKFGVLYCTEGQTDENDMFSNNSPSEDYLNFLSFLGTEITLEGWDKFRGGLDVRTNTTGTKSIFTTHENYEIMFHIATMLPFVSSDEQKLEKKRHLGNDVVLIVYKEGDQVFDPACIHSMFNHIFIVVQKVVGKDRYTVEVVYKGDIPKPPLPLLPDGTFQLNSNFHKWLLAKMINGERITMESSEFSGKLQRTRKMLMDDTRADFKVI